MKISKRNAISNAANQQRSPTRPANGNAGKASSVPDAFVPRDNGRRRTKSWPSDVFKSKSGTRRPWRVPERERRRSFVFFCLFLVGVRFEADPKPVESRGQAEGLVRSLTKLNGASLTAAGCCGLSLSTSSSSSSTTTTTTADVMASPSVRSMSRRRRRRISTAPFRWQPMADSHPSLCPRPLNPT